jgi:uncharacterized membrane-anchored protein
MKTLHQYHWQDMNGLHHGLALMCPGDALVIYGQLSTTEYQALLQDARLNAVNWHLVKTGSGPNMGKQLIDHAGWYRLITQHHNSCTWKT